MIRRVTAATGAALALAVLLTAPVGSQESPGPTVIDTTVENTTTTSAVGGEEVTTTTAEVESDEVTTTTAEVEADEVTTTRGEIGAQQVTTTRAAVEVAGETVTRGLPRTGEDIGAPTVIGLALTGLGIALAVGARRRRKQFESA